MPEEQKPLSLPKKPVEAKEKQKALAYVNWSIPSAVKGEKDLLRSSRGFPLFDNKYLTLEEKALIQLATDNDGTAIIAVEMRIIIAQEKPESLDISKIKLVTKAA